jgi:hypothetical protein
MWSEWNLLNSSCLLESGWTKSGLLRRERSVKKLPRGMGRLCPPLIQTTEVQGTPDRLQNCPRYDINIDLQGVEVGEVLKAVD